MKSSFSESEIYTSSTCRELKATLYVLASFADQLKEKVVKHHSDNLNVVMLCLMAAKMKLYTRLH